jgi:hypothetical protein
MAHRVRCCVVSKARSAPAKIELANAEKNDDGLRRELEALPLRDQRKRVKAEGMPAAGNEAAKYDSDEEPED